MLIIGLFEENFNLVYHGFNNMVDITPSTKGGKWVCPNDRQLALRAKLSTGWSVKTQDLQEYGKRPQALNEMEQNAIKQVIQRAEILEQKEQERVGRLVDRLDNMKRNVMGNGTTQCILCGDTFRLFGTSNFLCCGCKKLVCEKCGIEILSSNQEPLWLCKICSETREMWKKSGAWFFKGLPKYKLPEKKSEKYGVRKMTRPGIEKSNWSKSNADVSKPSTKSDATQEDDARYKRDGKRSVVKILKPGEDHGPNSRTSLSWGINQNTKSTKSFGGISAASGSSLFSNFGSDSGMGESERNIDRRRYSPREKYGRETSGESSESNNSSISRRTSSAFSESHQNLTTHTPCMSSVNRSYERLSIGNKTESSTSSYEKPSMFTLNPFKSGSEKFMSLSKPQLDEKGCSAQDKTVSLREVPGKKFPFSGKTSSSNSDVSHHSLGESDSSKYRKKVSIDFGKATSFLKYPLRNDKKKEKTKLNKFSSSESHLDSPSECGSVRRIGRGRGDNSIEYSSESDKSSGPTDIQSVLGANFWMSQDSSIHTFDSLSDLNLPNKIRRESMTSLSREYWSEDQLSLSSSLGTNQEDVSEAVGGKNAQLGLLELSLWYDPVRAALHCTLHRGKGLRSTDINGLADPFCKLNILPATGKSNRLKTKTVHKTINPEFNETLNFYGITEADIQKKTLHILVLDDDKYGNDFLGEARIPLFKVGAKQTKHVSVFLEKHYQVDEEDEVWGEDNWNKGQILVTLCYSTKKRALIVFIGRCANLLPMDNNGLSDPFVKLHLTPDPNHKKYKTSVKWKNLNPVFNEEFVFETKMTDLPKQTLVLTIWDKDYGKSNDYLGGLELGWKSKGERLKHWIDVIKFPDHKHEGWHRLGDDLITD